jgi:hypothetical protein
MGISCALGRHEVVTRGVGNGAFEFGRCLKCACDVMRSGRTWKRVPKGYKVVWRPIETPACGPVRHTAAAVGREVDLRGVTVVGERTYGTQRFALVVLNAKDRRDYRAMVDRLGTDGSNARMMKKSCAYSRPDLLKPREAAPRLGELTSGREPAPFPWEEATCVPAPRDFGPAAEWPARGAHSPLRRAA